MFDSFPTPQLTVSLSRCSSRTFSIPKKRSEIYSFNFPSISVPHLHPFLVGLCDATDAYPRADAYFAQSHSGVNVHLGGLSFTFMTARRLPFF